MRTRVFFSIVTTSPGLHVNSPLSPPIWLIPANTLSPAYHCKCEESMKKSSYEVSMRAS